MKKTGLIQIYTGDGKGKSTAAFGLSLRAAGWGMHTAIVQFMKKGDGYGEISALAQHPLIDIYPFGSGNFIKKGSPLSKEDLIYTSQAIDKVKELMEDERVDILVLDELTNAIYFGLISEAKVLELLSHKKPEQEWVITGRNAPQALLDRADLITEMKEVKHPYQKGISARRGIEY